jgi:AAA15 family ATPase/GTPase
MLEKLKLKNFRCFEDFTIEFDKFNVIVGKNNSGKSTIIDALKLVSNVVRYAPYRNRYLEDRDIPFSTVNLKYNYNDDEESLVFAKFSDGTEIEIIFPIEERPYANLLRNSKNIRDKLAREKILGIIPPVGTFDDEEKLGDRDYVGSVMISHLTPRHFRNIWYYYRKGFEEFQELIEKTWPGYSIDSPEFSSSV